MRLFQQKKLSTKQLLEKTPQVAIIFWTIMVVTTFIFILLLWGTFATIKETAITFGEIIPRGRVQQVQHLEGGIIKKIYVKNGDEVKKGQLLIKIDPTESKAELEQARGEEITLVLDKKRLEAFLEKKPANLVEWSKAVINSKYNTVKNRAQIESLLQKNRELLESQNKKRKEQHSVLETQLAQREEELKKFENQLVVWKKHIKLLKEEFKMYETLRKDNYISHKDYLTILRDLNNAKGEEERIQSEIKRLKKVIDENRLKLKVLDSTLNSEALKELVDTEDKLTVIRHRIEKLENTLEHTDIRSPITGIIKGLILYPGNVVKPGSVLFEVVPLDEELVAETRIDPKDIGHVKIGDKVLVKPLAYDYRRYGSIDGKLIEISASTFISEERKPFYRAMVKLDRQYLIEKGKKKYLKPGMTVQADIITGEKSLIRYLLRPIQSKTESAFTER